MDKQPQTTAGQPVRYEIWKGTDWSAATMRPGCLDHEAIPSRRGDVRVPYTPPQYYVTGKQ